MPYDKLTDDQIQKRLDDAIIKADPDKLTNDELDRRLYLRESGYKSPNLIQGSLDAAGDVLGMAGTVADYPLGIARSAADAIHDVFSNEKTPSEALSHVGEAFKGPSHATSSQELMEKVGVPDSPIPGTNIPQSGAAGFALDMVSGLGEGALANKLAKPLARGARAVLNADEMALKAVGTPARDNLRMIRSSMAENPSAPLTDAKEVSKYAQDNIVKPYSSTEKMLKKAGEKYNQVGVEIGSLRKKNQDIVTRWMERNPTTPDMVDYINGTFQPKASLQRIFTEIDKEIPSVKSADQIKSLITQELEPLHMKYQGQEIPIEDVARLKTHWQNEINFGKDSADYSAREAANNYLQREANRAIDNEFTFADKHLKGSDLAKHKKLKEEYGILSNMTANLQRKFAKEISSPLKYSDLVSAVNPLSPARVEKLAASIPENPSPLGAKSFVTANIGQAANMRSGEYKEPMIEGFRASQTAPVAPQEIQIYTQDIQKSNLSNIEKAKRLNLLNKHGRIFLGQ